MKTKKVVVGAIAATMLSLSVCSFAPVVAAGETVQITAGTAQAKAGESFSVDVSLAGIPTSGIQALDFAVTFDSSIITIDSVTQGEIAKTGADKADSSASLAPVFEASKNNDEGWVSLVWSTATDDSSYWISKDGVFCTIKGKVAAGAEAGSKSPLTITAIDRETYVGSGSTNATIGAGYQSASGGVVKYDVKTTDGSVEVIGADTVTTTTTKPVATTTTTTNAGQTTTTTTSGGGKTGIRGDANCDGQVKLNDAVLIMQNIANPNKFGLNGTDELHITSDGLANADVAGDPDGAATKKDMGGDGVSALDALKIQKKCLSLIDEL